MSTSVIPVASLLRELPFLLLTPRGIMYCTGLGGQNLDRPVRKTGASILIPPPHCCPSIMPYLGCHTKPRTQPFSTVLLAGRRAILPITHVLQSCYLQTS